MTRKKSADPPSVPAAVMKLHQKAEDHNFDASPSKVRSIIRRKNCDLGTALLLYWRGAPNYYRQFENREQMARDGGADPAVFDLLVEIEQRVVDGKYKTNLIPFDPFNDFGSNHAAAYTSYDCVFDLPVEMYGDVSGRKLKSVRPKSDRPVGLSWLAEQHEHGLNPRTIKAMEVLGPYSDSWGDPVAVRDDGTTAVEFLDCKVPDDVFKHLADLPSVVELHCGDRSTDAVLKHLRHAPALKELTIQGEFTARGLQHLKRVPRLERLEIWGKQLPDAALKCLRHVPKLERLELYVTGEIGKAGLEAIGQLKRLRQLTLCCSLAKSDLGWLAFHGIKELTLAGKSGLTDDHVQALKKLSRRKAFASIMIEKHDLTIFGVAELEESFSGVSVNIAPGRKVKKKDRQAATKKSGTKATAKKKSPVKRKATGKGAKGRRLKKRVFALSDGKSDKFWEIHQSGPDYTVRYGRRGTDGRTSTKSFATPEDCKVAADKLIAQKAGKGYIEVEG